MYRRAINISKNYSFFLFGARGTGKSSLIRELFAEESTLFIDLLRPAEFDLLNRDPEELSRRIAARESSTRWIVLDEVQRIPKLLNLVHFHIEESKQSDPLFFALTGSSARKLKRGSANLLAGRAITYSLFPLTHTELGSDFDLSHVLHWGSLPEVSNQPDHELKKKILQSYTHTYLKEEVQAEQLIRALDPFHRFLSVAAQMNGKIINYSALARECGASDSSVREYFQILEDTLLGFHLPPFHRSVRKRQRQNPRFYLFDNGVQRALANLLTIPLSPRTSAYGDAFESWLISEVHRLIHYAENDFILSYLRTKDDAEIDLIIERPGMKTALVEIKSTNEVTPESLATLNRFAKDMPDCAAYCLSQDPHPKKIELVTALPWQKGLQELGVCPE
ncbi:AAA family ATPase [bacterium]|nr:AAA family ATPase [bacterium]